MNPTQEESDKHDLWDEQKVQDTWTVCTHVLQNIRNPPLHPELFTSSSTQVYNVSSSGHFYPSMQMYVFEHMNCGKFTVLPFSHKDIVTKGSFLQKSLFHEFNIFSHLPVPLEFCLFFFT